jgi:D-alanyl-D-alanine dipeptidase
MNYPTDEELAKIPVKDNGEKLVDLRMVCPDVEIKLPDFMATENAENQKLAGYVRESVAQRIKKANSFLPEGYKLMVRFGYRPLKVQKLVWDRVNKKMSEKYPDWPEGRIKKETQKFAAPVDTDLVPPHTTGATVDLTITGQNGKWVDMGTKLGEFNERTVFEAKGLTEEQAKNRQILRNAMIKAGFVNYHAEWWHWSYGDQYWAKILNKPNAIYGAIKLDII